MASGGIELKTPPGKVAPVWAYFGYKVDATIGKVKSSASTKPTCTLYKAEISNCGGTTNLWNHLQAMHPIKYSELLSHESSRVGQPSVTMDRFIEKYMEGHGLLKSCLLIRPELRC